MNKTKIEWADYTWNPITGCSPISAGCARCYALAISKRFNGGDHSVKFHPERLSQPLVVKKPSKIFVCSMSDIFHDDVKTEWIDDILEIIAACPQHTFMFLTKRAHNIEKKLYEVTDGNPCRALGGGDYYKNLWLGVTVESAKFLSRIHELLKVPAAVRFVSVEPMLSAIDIAQHPGLDWVICGAETGPGARPMDLAWARDLRDQCAESSVPFFFKKAGNKIETPPDLMVRQWPGGK